MATVSAEIKRLLKAKEQRVLDGQAAIDALLREVRRQINEELRSVPGDSYSAYHLKQNLASIEKHLQDFASKAGRELSGQVEAAWIDGEELVQAVGRTGGLFTAFGHVSTSVLDVLKEYSTHKIYGVSQAAFEQIRGELTLGMLGQKTPWEVAQAIAGEIEGAPMPTIAGRAVFQSTAERAEVITGVEMGRAYSQATQLAMAQATQSVPDLKKQWWHAGHPKRPRLSHLALHGQIQPVDKPFMVGTLTMMFPRDPKAPASEVIRCGCEHVPWHESFGRDNALPIYNERGQEIARRGPRTGEEEPLVGKFKIGEIDRKRGKGTQNG